MSDPDYGSAVRPHQLRDGKTWPWKQTYYEGGSGYSDACVLPDGRVAVLFEKDGKSKLGFTIVPAPPATPPKK